MISTGTLGEKKANVKTDFCFALLSPHAFSDASGSEIQTFCRGNLHALFPSPCSPGFTRGAVKPRTSPSHCQHQKRFPTPVLERHQQKPRGRVCRGRRTHPRAVWS